MADLSRLKRRSSLGAPPPAEEASPNLAAPETAPASLPSRETPIAQEPRPAAQGQGRLMRDGRTARRTGRTIQFATRVSADFDDRLRTIAERDGILLVEVLERALDAYEAGVAVLRK
jgi:hypothetical protein